MDKANLFGKLIDKGFIKDSLFDSLTVFVSKMGSDMDKANIYNKMLKINSITESQWIILINQSESLGSDMGKSNMLMEIAKNMPKTIGNDNDYGRVMRALE